MTRFLRKIVFCLALSLIVAPAGAEGFTRLQSPQAIPDIAFQDESGKMRRLSEYRGRPVLLNLWATWCLPCVTELPALDKLAAQQEKKGLVVLALSVDRKGIPAVKRFFEDNGIKHLDVLVDPVHDALNRLGASSLPATLFIDKQGREIARRHIGPLVWDAPDIRQSLNALFTKESSP